MPKTRKTKNKQRTIYTRLNDTLRCDLNNSLDNFRMQKYQETPIVVPKELSKKEKIIQNALEEFNENRRLDCEINSLLEKTRILL